MPVGVPTDTGPFLSKGTKFSATSNPSRSVNTAIINGRSKRIVNVSIDLNSAVAGKAYAGFITVSGGKSWTVADYVGLPSGAALAVTPRFSYTFTVDPMQTYQITTDLGTGATGTLFTVIEVDI